MFGQSQSQSEPRYVGSVICIFSIYPIITQIPLLICQEENQYNICAYRVHQSVLTGGLDSVKNMQIYKNLQDRLTMAARRVRCRKLRKGYLHVGDLKGPVEVL